jgi:dCTP deaminase
VILPDHEIRQLCFDEAMILPYNEDQLQPASYDVRLGNDFRIFKRGQYAWIDLAHPIDITRLVHIEDGDKLMLHPDEFALGVTQEVVDVPSNIAAKIEGKSTIGRLGLSIHITAGYIDPGFHGAVTLELSSRHPLTLALRPWMLIAQLSFHQLSSPAEQPYKGRYQNATTVEAGKRSK